MSSTLTREDILKAKRTLDSAYAPQPRFLGVPSWGEMKRVPSGRRWWQLWKPRWTWMRREPDHVLELSCGTVLCTAQQKAELERQLQVKGYGTCRAHSADGPGACICGRTQ